MLLQHLLLCWSGCYERAKGHNAFAGFVAGFVDANFDFAFVGPLWNNLVGTYASLAFILFAHGAVALYMIRYSEFYMSWFTKVVITVSGFIGMYLVSYFKIFKTIIAEDPELDEYGREHIVE